MKQLSIKLILTITLVLLVFNLLLVFYLMGYFAKPANNTQNTKSLSIPRENPNSKRINLEKSHQNYFLLIQKKIINNKEVVAWVKKLPKVYSEKSANGNQGLQQVNCDSSFNLNESLLVYY